MDRDDQIIDYLQGRLTPEARTRFEAEMAADTKLAAEVDVLRAVRGELGAAPIHAGAEDVWRRLETSFEAAPRAANRNSAPWQQLARYAAVAVLAVASWQLGVAPLLTEAPPEYRAASEADTGFALQVRFAESATMAEVTALLTQLDGRIADGPSALGFLRVEFADEEQRTEALDLLSAGNALVDVVQRP